MVPDSCFRFHPGTHTSLISCTYAGIAYFEPNSLHEGRQGNIHAYTEKYRERESSEQSKEAKHEMCRCRSIPRLALNGDGSAAIQLHTYIIKPSPTKGHLYFLPTYFRPTDRVLACYVWFDLAAGLSHPLWIMIVPPQTTNGYDLSTLPSYRMRYRISFFPSFSLTQFLCSQCLPATTVYFMFLLFH